MTDVGLAAGLFALAVAMVTDAAVGVDGPLSIETIGVAGVGFRLLIDALSAAMLTLVAFVGVVVLSYSRNYLDGDPNQGVFFKRLGFTEAIAWQIGSNLAQPLLDGYNLLKKAGSKCRMSAKIASGPVASSAPSK